MRIQIPKHKQELVLGKVEVHERQRNGMKSEIPGRIPGIFPLVGHGEHVAVEHVEPLGISGFAVRVPEQGVSFVLVQPFVQIEVVVLLAPEHSGERLAMHAALVLTQCFWGDPLVEFVRVRQAGLEYLLKIAEGIRRGLRAEPQPHYFTASRGDLQAVMRGGLGPGPGRIHSVAPAQDNTLVERIFHIRRGICLPPQAARVGLVLREQQLRIAFAM